MRTTGAVAFVLALVAASCAASSGSSAVAPPRLSTAPRALEPGAAWQARLTASGGGARLVVTASDGARTLRFAASRRGRDVYTLRLSFPHTGTWRLATVVAGRRHALRPVRVALPLVEAYKVVVDRDGTLLVADANRGRGRIVRIDAASGRRSIVVRPGGRVYSVAVGPDGLVYVVAANRVLRIEAGGHVTPLAELVDAFAVAFGADRLYVSQQTSPDIRVVDLASGAVRTFASGFDQPLGMTTLSDGTLLVADSRRGRVVALTPDGAMSTFQDGMTLPVDVAPGRDGSVLVVDHVAHDGPTPGRIFRHDRNGRVTIVSEGQAIALTSAAEAPDGTIYATSFDARYPVGVIDPATGALRPLAG